MSLTGFLFVGPNLTAGKPIGIRAAGCASSGILHTSRITSSMREWLVVIKVPRPKDRAASNIFWTAKYIELPATRVFVSDVGEESLYKQGIMIAGAVFKFVKKFSAPDIISL
tara:strand:+ start:2787 stop:3122 length:336 start_codon:yes stop_codon:yes gene_type:complete